MTVYVDDMLRPARVGAIRSRWSHLFADSTAELHDTGTRLGLDPAWVQHPGTRREHFDLTEGKRQLALRLGATPIAYPHGAADLLDRKRRATSGGAA
jgi:hypothetical protein